MSIPQGPPVPQKAWCKRTGTISLWCRAAVQSPSSGRRCQPVVSPLAHSFARLEEFLGLYLGLTTAFAESIEALAQNMREVRPDAGL